MTETISDRQLVLQSQTGDRAAFEQLVRNCGRLVYVRIYPSTNDTHKAEDLTQEAFFTAWRSLSSLRDPDQFRPWLLAIADRLTIDAARHAVRKKRDAARMKNDGLDQVKDQQSGPQHSAELAEQRKLLLDALAAIPEQYRTPLTLRYLAGADYSQMEKQLAISNGTLRGLLYRGLRMLREILESSDPSDTSQAGEP